jgi:hypothetical protein
MEARLLKLFLGFAGCVWGVSVFGVFASWAAAEEALRGLGAKEIVYDQMLDYWLRMAAGAFSLVGCWYFVLMARMETFWTAIPWFGGLMVVEGLVLLGHGLRLGLPALPFWADVSACLGGGTAIVLLWRRVGLASSGEA